MFNLLFVGLGKDSKPDRWGFVETLLNQFVYNCLFPSEQLKLENRCLNLSKNLSSEFEWLPDIIANHILGKLEGIQVLTSLKNYSNDFLDCFLTFFSNEKNYSLPILDSRIH